jgi:hypothetical protein
VTLEKIEKGLRIPSPEPAREDEFPLPAWYRVVRNKPLSEFSIEDVCKSCRQNLYPEHIVPLALNLLEANVLAGELYDGELLVSLKSVPQNYWTENSDHRDFLLRIIKKTKDRSEESLQKDLEELLIKLK